MLVQINKIVIIIILVVSCETPSKVVFGSETIYRGLILPYEISQNLYVKKSNSYGYFYNEKKELLLYTYYNEDSKIIFQYNYLENSFIGSPFIYCFDYFYNDTFTIICEVAEPEAVVSKYYINLIEVIPDTNNLVFYKFKNASHSGDFELTITMRNEKFNNQGKVWKQKINLIDSTYFNKKSLLEHDLWNYNIP